MPVSEQAVYLSPRQRVCSLIQGNLEASAGGPVRGRLYEDRYRRVDTRHGFFLLFSLPQQLLQAVLVMHCRRPFWPCHWVGGEAHQEP